MEAISMCQITLSVPEESLLALKVTPEEMAREIRMSAAIKHFELGRLFSGRAPELAGMPRTVFLPKLGASGGTSEACSRLGPGVDQQGQWLRREEASAVKRASNPSKPPRRISVAVIDPEGPGEESEPFSDTESTSREPRTRIA